LVLEIFAVILLQDLLLVFIGLAKDNINLCFPLPVLIIRYFNISTYALTVMCSFKIVVVSMEMIFVKYMPSTRVIVNLIVLEV
jgi:hypothetical protein